MEVNPFYEREIKRSDFRKVPVLMVDAEKLVNASDIIDEMFKRIYPDSNGVGGGYNFVASLNNEYLRRFNARSKWLALIFHFRSKHSRWKPLNQVALKCLSRY